MQGKGGLVVTVVIGLVLFVGGLFAFPQVYDKGFPLILPTMLATVGGMAMLFASLAGLAGGADRAPDSHDPHSH